MGLVKAKPEIDLVEVAFHNTVKRGVELAQSQIVRTLGRKPPFTKVLVGRTDVDLGKVAQERQGYIVTNLFTSPNSRATEEIERVLAVWLRACHGQRCENGKGGTKPVKQGVKSVFLAVQ